MNNPTRRYPQPHITHDAPGIVSHAGATLLTRTATHPGLDHAVHVALAPWRGRHTIHDPGKILLDLALATALGGDCLADIHLLREQPEVFGPSPPTRPSPASWRPSPLTPTGC